MFLTFLNFPLATWLIFKIIVLQKWLLLYYKLRKWKLFFSSRKKCGDNGNNRRRRAEDRLALTFVAIVVGFLVTNFPRIFLNFHEVLVFEDSMACMSAGKMWENRYYFFPHFPFNFFFSRGFPVWSRIAVPFSQMLMVLNSSMNIVFYGLFNTQFRKVARYEFLDIFNFYFFEWM